LQQDCVDHTEDRGVRANPEREREYSNDSEARIFHELSNRVAKIV
jgi:hypothetical protein